MPRSSPIVYLCAAFAGGILTYTIIKPTLAIAIACFILAAILASLNRTSAIAVIALFLTAGILLTCLKSARTEEAVLRRAALKGDTINITAEVASEPKSVRGGIQLELNVLRAAEGTIGRRLNETALAVVRTEKRGVENVFRPGYKVAIDARPRIPESGPDSEFDYRAHLDRRGVAAQFFVDLDEVRIVERRADLTDGVRRRLRRLIVGGMPPPLGGLLMAILLGDTRDVPENVKIDFERAGILHLFAVSGLNVTLSVAFVFFLARMLRLPPTARLIAALASLLFYLSLVGGGASVNRAAVMVVVALFSWYLARRLDIMAAVGAAAFILLALDPFSLYDISFMLSFGAVIGIVVISPAIVGSFKPELRPVVTPAAVTAGAQLAVAPVLAYYFNQFSIVSLLANMALVPPVTLMTGIGFFGMLISNISETAAAAIFRALTPLVAYLTHGASFFAELPGAAMTVGRPSAASITLYLAALTGMVAVSSRRKFQAGFGTFLIAILAFLTMGVWSQIPATIAGPAMTISFLDIGQGDATLIRLPGGRTILIDGGPNFNTLNTELAARGVRKIDVMIVSHPHADHITGLIGVVRRYPVGVVIDPGYPHPSPIYKEFLTVIKEEGVKYRLARRGDRYPMDRAEVAILSPGDRFISGSNSDPNNNSAVVKLTFGKFRTLFPGDIEKEKIGELLADGVDLSADLLKVAHQGSRTSTTAGFLKAVGARDGVIFVGRGNKYGHPHREALRLLRSAGVHYLRTDREGTVEVESDGMRYSVKANGKPY